jgi:hypothetical protein
MPTKTGPKMSPAPTDPEDQSVLPPVRVQVFLLRELVIANPDTGFMYEASIVPFGPSDQCEPASSRKASKKSETMQIALCHAPLPSEATCVARGAFPANRHRAWGMQHWLAMADLFL